MAVVPDRHDSTEAMLQTQASRRRVSAAVVALGLTGGTAVVAIAARAPLSRSTQIDAASASAPAGALLLVLACGGLVLLAALALLAPARRRRKDDLPEPEPTTPELPWIVKLVAAVLPLALAAAIVVAVLSGAKRLHNAPIPGSGVALRLGSGPGRASPASPGGTRTGFVLPSWLAWTALGLVAAVAIVAVAAVVVIVRRERRPASDPAGAAGAAVEAAISALEADSDPRRAVIAAYAAMQRTLAVYGLVRLGSEAPREFLSRVLVASRSTEREAATLTGLFEEARFSTHPIPERTRGRALAALGSLQARLSAGEAL